MNLIPLRTISSLKQESTGNVQVRVRGTVLDARPGEYIVVHDATGTIFAETHQASLPEVKELVDLVGQPVWNAYSLSLKNSVVSSLTTNGQSNSKTAFPTIKPATLPLLTKAWEVRDLPAEKAAWHYPVRLRGVVTVNIKANHYFFVQDDSAGITVQTPEIPTGLNPGDLVKIEGVSDPGGFSPIVLASNVTVIGEASLPEARPVTMFQLASGQQGSQWIEVRGVVRGMTSSNGIVTLRLNDSSGAIIVNLPAEQEPTNLLDAIVSIQGACSSKSNDKRQFTGFMIWASSLANVQIKEPGVSDPLNLPAQPIASLGQFHPRETLQHRINLAGIVTHVEPDFFFIQDADAGVKVMSARNEQLKPGDYVMTAGYPSMGDYGYVLNDAIFRVISHRPIPAPVQLTTEKPVNPQFHDLWVQISARFLHYSKIGPADTLTLQIGNRVFDARILAPVSERIKNLQPGSLLHVTGLYRVLMDEARVPKSLQLAVPSEHEIQILDEPSWWTVEHTASVVLFMASVLGATALWVMLLRRKVQAQTSSLRQSERKFRLLVEQSLVGVYIVQDEQFVYINPRMAALFGYTKEELTGSWELGDMVLPEDLPLVREQVRRRIADEVDYAHYTFRGRRKDGAIVHVEVLGSRAEFNGQPAVLGMLLDITERKLAQDKIAEQARMLDLASDAIMVCDLQDRILYWNENARRIYGWTAEQAVGGPAVEKMRVDPAEFQKARQAVLKNHQWQGEFIHDDLAGGEIIAAARWTLVHDPQGKAGSILAIHTDITQQKKMEAQFLRTQRLESIGVLAGGIAHDLNNTLAPILMSAHLLKADPDAPEREELLTSISSSTERAANLVRQILTFARGTDGRQVAVQPQYLLEELQKILGEILPKSIQLRIRVAPDTWAITADATQLHQVLMNLCINARDAMPGGGELAVEVANIELNGQHVAEIREVKPGPHVVFSVADNGSGMTPEIRERIFDPFFTTKEVGKGTGLGLSTSLGIVKSHKGFINVHTEPGSGSCFKVYFPATTTTSATAQPEEKGKPFTHGNNELILVVDDEDSVRNITKRTLQMFGYRVITAGNGAEAVACYVRQQEEICLVVLDMMMPVLDGPATIHALTEMNPDVKIIAASGLIGESSITSPSVCAFLPKPYNADALLRAVHEVLHPTPVNPPAQAE